MRRQFRGNPSVVDDERRVRPEGRATGELGDPRKEPGGERGPTHAGSLGVGGRSVDGIAGNVLGECRLPRVPARTRARRSPARDPGEGRRPPPLRPGPRPDVAPRSPRNGQRTRAAPPARPTGPARPVSPGTRALRARRGWPSARRRRPPSGCGRAPRDPMRCRRMPAGPRDQPGRPGARRRSRRSRTPGFPRRAPRSSWPTPSWPPNRLGSARRPWSAVPPCAPSQPGRSPASRAPAHPAPRAAARLGSRRSPARRHRSRARPPRTRARPRDSAGTATRG